MAEISSLSLNTTYSPNPVNRSNSPAAIGGRLNLKVTQVPIPKSKVPYPYLKSLTEFPASTRRGLQQPSIPKHIHERMSPLDISFFSAVGGTLSLGLSCKWQRYAAQASPRPDTRPPLARPGKSPRKERGRCRTTPSGEEAGSET